MTANSIVPGVRSSIVPGGRSSFVAGDEEGDEEGGEVSELTCSCLGELTTGSVVPIEV